MNTPWTNKKTKFWKKGALAGFAVAFVLIIPYSVWVDIASAESSDGYIPFYIAASIMAATYCIPTAILGALIGLFIDKKRKP